MDIKSTVAEEEEVESGSEENGSKKIRFSVVNLNNKDPYYEIVIKKSHSIFMTIPISFARWTGIMYMKRMRLVNGKGKEWRVNIARKGRWVHIKGGWAEFQTCNKIATGDTCRFKFIQGNGGKNVLQVLKISKPHSLQ
ncbi:B3 domain-containing protein REM8-like [Lycium barbarum]|uniref:B3 domain-containing protein REM8-like n=1 Tax=Lycium barbarum TaxID=112863 RepID=UPI00293E476D|nr:B3 domain-containing protein REM8-like [Lycium barbarum]